MEDKITENILQLQNVFISLFGNDYLSNCFIEVENGEHDITLSANREGMLYLVQKLLELCKQNKIQNHYHLDKAGMANKCTKPMIISLVKEDW